MRTARIAASGLAFLFVLALGATRPADAATIDKTFPFQLDKWYDLNVSDGPVTIHRVRVATVSGNVKSKIFRGSNSVFNETVQIQVEYTNDSARDYEADLDIVWLDAQGEEIDGYRDEEGIDENEHDEMTAAFSTLRYGLDRAKTLKVHIRF